MISRRKLVGIAFFGTWMLFGLYLDGWAHHNDKPETFFTPWHAVLYSGFVCGALFWIWESRRERQQVRRSLDVERIALLGLVLFVAGAVGDGLWHELIGTEVSIEALLSPTHLLLMIGGLMMVTTPIRAVWNEPEKSPSLRAFAPTLVAFVLSAALVSFFLMYLSAFEPWNQPAYRPPRAFSQEETRAIVGIASILVTNAILMAPALWMLRRWMPPAASFTLLFTAVPFAMSAMHSFERLPLVAAGLVAGLVADGWTRKIATEGPTRRTVWAFSIVIPTVLWSTWFGLYALLYGLSWAPELWLGSIIFAAMTGWGLCLLVFDGAPETKRLVADVV